MAEEKFQKQLDHALVGMEVEQLDMNDIQTFYELATDKLWSFTGDTFDQLGLAGLSLNSSDRIKFLAIIHREAMKASKRGA